MGEPTHFFKIRKPKKRVLESSLIIKRYFAITSAYMLLYGNGGCCFFLYVLVEYAQYASKSLILIG